MKCDELHPASLFEFEKVLKGKSNKLFYAKADVDAAIAELKANNERITIDNRNNELRAIESATVVIENVHLVYRKSEADKVILKLKADNERLTRAIVVYQESISVHKGKCAELSMKLCERRNENKRLKRALWLARAKKAHVTTLLWNVYCYQNNCLYYRDFMNAKCNPFRDLPKKTAMEWSDLWKFIETKCLAKAKEYK